MIMVNGYPGNGRTCRLLEQSRPPRRAGSAVHHRLVFAQHLGRVKMGGHLEVFDAVLRDLRVTRGAQGVRSFGHVTHRNELLSLQVLDKTVGTYIAHFSDLACMVGWGAFVD